MENDPLMAEDLGIRDLPLCRLSSPFKNSATKGNLQRGIYAVNRLRYKMRHSRNRLSQDASRQKASKVGNKENSRLNSDLNNLRSYHIQTPSLQERPLLLGRAMTSDKQKSGRLWRFEQAYMQLRQEELSTPQLYNDFSGNSVDLQDQNRQRPDRYRTIEPDPDDLEEDGAVVTSEKPTGCRHRQNQTIDMDENRMTVARSTQFSNPGSFFDALNTSYNPGERASTNLFNQTTPAQPTAPYILAHSAGSWGPRKAPAKPFSATQKKPGERRQTPLETILAHYKKKNMLEEVKSDRGQRFYYPRDLVEQTRKDLEREREEQQKRERLVLPPTKSCEVKKKKKKPRVKKGAEQEDPQIINIRTKKGRPGYEEAGTQMSRGQYRLSSGNKTKSKEKEKEGSGELESCCKKSIANQQLESPSGTSPPADSRRTAQKQYGDLRIQQEALREFESQSVSQVDSKSSYQRSGINKECRRGLPNVKSQQYDFLSEEAGMLNPLPIPQTSAEPSVNHNTLQGVTRPRTSKLTHKPPSGKAKQGQNIRIGALIQMAKTSSRHLMGAGQKNDAEATLNDSFDHRQFASNGNLPDFNDSRPVSETDQQKQGILQKCRTFRASDQGAQGYPPEDRKSVKFDLKSPPKVAVPDNLYLEKKLLLRNLKSEEASPRGTKDLEFQLSDHDQRTIQELGIQEEQEGSEHNETNQGTVGLEDNDLWRAHPSLQVLKEELELISNDQQCNFNVNMQLVDWFDVQLYQVIYETKQFSFNQKGDQKLFNSQAEVSACLNNIMYCFQEDKRKSVNSKNKILVENYVRGISTMRKILKEELGLTSVYQKYIQIHGYQLNLENVSRLLIRVKLLLQGRKILCQILMIIIERNNLIQSVKQMIALDQQCDNNSSENEEGKAGDGDLGDFQFDDSLAKQLGEQIVSYSVVVQQLIKMLINLKALPGFRVDSMDNEGTFVFRGTDFVKYIRTETNQIKHLLYVYKIYV